MSKSTSNPPAEEWRMMAATARLLAGRTLLPLGQNEWLIELAAEYDRHAVAREAGGFST